MNHEGFHVCLELGRGSCESLRLYCIGTLSDWYWAPGHRPVHRRSRM